MPVIVLLPCPYCRGDPKVERARDPLQAVAVACRDCGARYEGPVIDGWNHSSRVAPPAPP